MSGEHEKVAVHAAADARNDMQAEVAILGVCRQAINQHLLLHLHRQPPRIHRQLTYLTSHDINNVKCQQFQQPERPEPHHLQCNLPEGRILYLIWIRLSILIYRSRCLSRKRAYHCLTRYDHLLLARQVLDYHPRHLISAHKEGKSRGQPIFQLSKMSAKRNISM